MKKTESMLAEKGMRWLTPSRKPVQSTIELIHDDLLEEAWTNRHSEKPVRWVLMELMKQAFLRDGFLEIQDVECFSKKMGARVLNELPKEFFIEVVVRYASLNNRMYISWKTVPLKEYIRKNENKNCPWLNRINPKWKVKRIFNLEQAEEEMHKCAKEFLKENISRVDLEKLTSFFYDELGPVFFKEVVQEYENNVNRTKK